MGNQFSYYQHLDAGDRVLLKLNHNLELSIKREAEGYVIDGYCPLLLNKVIELGCIFDFDLEEPEEEMK